MSRLVVVLLLALGLAAPAGADPALVLADCQVRALAGERWVVQLRSTGPQAFDVERADGVVIVRLHGARRGDLAPPAPHVFGTLAIDEDAGGVVVRVQPSEPAWQTTVRQGGSANEVELRVTR